MQLNVVLVALERTHVPPFEQKLGWQIFFEVVVVGRTEMDDASEVVEIGREVGVTEVDEAAEVVVEVNKLVVKVDDANIDVSSLSEVVKIVDPVIVVVVLSIGETYVDVSDVANKVLVVAELSEVRRLEALEVVEVMANEVVPIDWDVVVVDGLFVVVLLILANISVLVVVVPIKFVVEDSEKAADVVGDMLVVDA